MKYTKQVVGNTILTRSFLQEQIIDKNKSIDEIVEETGLDKYEIENRLIKFNINSKNSISDEKVTYCNPIITLDYIMEEHVRKQRSIKSIAKELNMHRRTLARKIIKLGIKSTPKVFLNLTEEQKLNLRWEHLTPIKKAEKAKCGKAVYTFKCSCGKYADIIWENVLNLKQSTCGKCRWHEEIKLQVWSNIIKSAKTRNLEFSITKDYIWDMYLKQDRKCIFTGLPIIFDSMGKTTASLDRIDNDKGYIEGNIQLVHKCINRMRGTLNVELFKYLCTLIAENSNVDKSQFQNKEIKQRYQTPYCE